MLQESSPQNNFRRIIASYLRANEFCNHTVDYCTEKSSTVDLLFVVAFLNSTIADWYFRLGSTNAHVSHYQLYNLPCPRFADKYTSTDEKLSARIGAEFAVNRHDRALAILRALLANPPFSLVVRDAIVAVVKRIIEIEQARGEISRSDRSALSPAAQPYQDFIDQLFYGMAGLTDSEVNGLEKRYATML